MRKGVKIPVAESPEIKVTGVKRSRISTSQRALIYELESENEEEPVEQHFSQSIIASVVRGVDGMVDGDVVLFPIDPKTYLDVKDQNMTDAYVYGSDVRNVDTMSDRDYYVGEILVANWVVTKGDCPSDDAIKVTNNLWVECPAAYVTLDAEAAVSLSSAKTSQLSYPSDSLSQSSSSAPSAVVQKLTTVVTARADQVGINARYPLSYVMRAAGNHEQECNLTLRPDTLLEVTKFISKGRAMVAMSPSVVINSVRDQWSGYHSTVALMSKVILDGELGAYKLLFGDHLLQNEDVVARFPDRNVIHQRILKLTEMQWSSELVLTTFNGELLYMMLLDGLEYDVSSGCGKERITPLAGTHTTRLSVLKLETPPTDHSNLVFSVLTPEARRLLFECFVVAFRNVSLGYSKGCCDKVFPLAAVSVVQRYVWFARFREFIGSLRNKRELVFKEMNMFSLLVQRQAQFILHERVSIPYNSCSDDSFIGFEYQFVDPLPDDFKTRTTVHPPPTPANETPFFVQEKKKTKAAKTGTASTPSGSSSGATPSGSSSGAPKPLVEPDFQAALKKLRLAEMNKITKAKYELEELNKTSASSPEQDKLRATWERKLNKAESKLADLNK